MSVSIASHRRCRGVRASQVRRDAARLLNLLAVDGELSIALVDDEEMRGLNARYRRTDRPTDVLSFGVAGGTRSVVSGVGGRGSIKTADTEVGPPDMRAQLGDVVISVDTAIRQAAAYGVGVDDEIRRLLTHGILHLLGYDHEHSPAEARRMFAKQRRLLRHLRTED